MSDTSKTDVTPERHVSLSNYNGSDQVVSSTDMRFHLSNQPPPPPTIYSGLGQLDRACGGFRAGELIVISGPTKNGKTLLAQTLTVSFAHGGAHSLWVSFEVPIPQFLGQVPESCEFFLPAINKANDLLWLDDRILESKLKHHTQLVFIDHLHYLIDLAKGKNWNLSIDIGMVIRELKQCAMRHNVIIFLMAHSTKAQTPAGETREVTQWDVRDSSMIPQEADSTWIVQRRQDERTKRYTTQAMLKVCCHRHTGVMDERMTLVKRGMLFESEHSDDDGDQSDLRQEGLL